MKGCRGVGKKDMKLNDKLPKMSVDPETYEVRVRLRCLSDKGSAARLTK